VTLSSFAATLEELMTIKLAPVLTDTFDFHDGDGTGSWDHLLFRLQKRGRAKPFTIEGQGKSITEHVSASASH